MPDGSERHDSEHQYTDESEISGRKTVAQKAGGHIPPNSIGLQMITLPFGMGRMDSGTPNICDPVWKL